MKRYQSEIQDFPCEPAEHKQGQGCLTGPSWWHKKLLSRHICEVAHGWFPQVKGGFSYCIILLWAREEEFSWSHTTRKQFIIIKGIITVWNFSEFPRKLLNFYQDLEFMHLIIIYIYCNFKQQSTHLVYMFSIFFRDRNFFANPFKIVIRWIFLGGDHFVSCCDTGLGIKLLQPGMYVFSLNRCMVKLS